VIFLEADIANVMGAIFDAPMASHEGEQAPRRRLLRGEISDEINDLDRGLAFLGNGARYFSDLGNQGSGGCEIGVHFGDFPE
jgi:hypothetical protein